MFSKTTSIQRVNTVGGVAPANSCAGSNVGQQARVHYRADYYFFSAATPVAKAFDGPARFSAL